MYTTLKHFITTTYKLGVGNFRLSRYEVIDIFHFTKMGTYINIYKSCTFIINTWSTENCFEGCIWTMGHSYFKRLVYKNESIKNITHSIVINVYLFEHSINMLIMKKLNAICYPFFFPNIVSASGVPLFGNGFFSLIQVIGFCIT